MVRFVVGIDPGLTGAVAVLGTDGTIIRVEDTPSFLLEGKRRDFNVPGMVNLLDHGDDLDDLVHETHVFIERQQSRPEQGVASVFKIGYGFGLWVGMLSFVHVPYSIVSPQTWQRVMYQGAVGEGKERSLLIASRLWPGLVIPKTRHDRADALLIAEYGRRTLLGQTPRWEDVG